MDRDAFFDKIESELDDLLPDARNGFGVLLDEAERRSTPLNYLAYILATAWWETAFTMQPVREAFYISKSFDKAEKWRKNNLKYYPYYGRGFVQLTHDYNYAKAKKKLGVDFVKNPDRVMELQYAVPITFDGMEEGWFTGMALKDYIDGLDEDDARDREEFEKARRVVNGNDKAQKIAQIAITFEHALRDAEYAMPSTADAATTPVIVSSTSGVEAHIASLGLRHFKPYEFLVKGGSHSNPDSPAFGLNTDPPKGLWKNIDATARVIDALREKLGRPIVLSSVYRSPAYNNAIGGAGDSQHTHFRAIDFGVVGSPVGPAQWATVLRDMRSTGAFKGGIGVYATFVHVDTRGTNADWVG